MEVPMRPVSVSYEQKFLRTHLSRSKELFPDIYYRAIRSILRSGFPFRGPYSDVFWKWARIGNRNSYKESSLHSTVCTGFPWCRYSSSAGNIYLIPADFIPIYRTSEDI